MTFRNFLASAAVATATLAASTAAFAAANTDNKSATGTADIIQPLSVSVGGGDLAFGTIVRPRSTETGGTVTITNTAGTPTRAASSGSGIILVGGATTTAPTFDISGESGSKYQLDVGALTLNGPSSAALTVTLVSTLVDGSSTATLSGAGSFHETFAGDGIGAADTAHLYVGGSIPVTKDSTSGHYTGDFTVTATYE